MMPNTTLPIATRPLSFIFLSLIAFPCLVQAQQDSSQYDRGTPPQHAAGISPIGSYISTDLGTINLSNGSLNFKLPLGDVGGRGFSLPLTLNYSSKVWSGSTGTDVVNDPIYRTYKAAIAVYDSNEGAPDIYQRVAPGWTLGAVPMLRARGVGVITVNHPSCGSPVDYLKIVTKLTLMLPDKGEIELRDDYTDGSPLGALPMPPANCREMDGNRGQRWHATDGSGIVFINDASNGIVNGNLNGWVITADGTRYRFDDTAAYFSGSAYLNEFARAESVTDRHGNRVLIFYSTAPNLAVTYTDQLGRTITIEYNVTDPANGELLAARVTLPGYGGQSRQYKLKTGLMNQNYRAGINPTLPVYNGYTLGMSGDESFCGRPPQTYTETELFASWCGGAERLDDRTVLTQVVLPDNRSLRFRYNEYGEVAEVEMPTGGKVQYDYAYKNRLPAGNSAAFEVNPSPGPGNVAAIDRAVVARRSYTDGFNADAYWSYDYTATPGSNGAASNGVAEIIARAADNSTVLLHQKHFFLNAARFLTSNGGTGYSLWSTGVERRSETLDAGGAVVLNASEQDWSQRSLVAWSYGYPSEQTQNDNRVNEERKILDDGQVARSTTLYDQFNNPIETSEFDFDNTLKRRTATSYSSTNPVNGLNYAEDSIRLLRLPLQQSVYDAGGVEQARSVYEYDVYTADLYHDYLLSYASITGHDTANYGVGRTARGNVTRIGKWIKSSDSYVYSYPRYDLAGNVVSTRDPKGNITTLSFADDFGDGSNPGAGSSGTYGATYSLPTLITSPPPMPGAPVHTARTQYDFSSGLLTGFKDRNGVITQTIYNDPFDRPTLVKSALGVSGVEAHAAMYYAPNTAFGITLTNNDVLTAKDEATLDDATLRSWTHTDGFGRTVDTWSRDPQGDDKVSTLYDALGRVIQQSNPFRPSQESAIYSTTVYDLAGRVTSVTTPDSAAVNSYYIGNQVLVKDQMAKERMSQTNALGQLTDVWEILSTADAANDEAKEAITFPNHSEVAWAYRTKYAYDTLGNLITVTQQKGTAGTTHTRSFVYNSLSQLTDATNPESGHIVYDYDPNGNLWHKTDARGVAITYDYDALNRNKTIDYSDTSGINPDVTRTYDGASNGIGRLWESYAGGTSTVGSNVEHTKVTSYDALGRPLIQIQEFKANNVWLPPYQTQRGNGVVPAYDLAGHVRSQTYPSGHSVTYNYDTAGRLADKDASNLAFIGNLGDGGASRTYSRGISYSPFGGLSQEQFGTDTPIYNKLFYNSRGQLAEIREGITPNDTNWERGAIINFYGACWGMCGGENSTIPMTDNNGNLKRQEIYIPGGPMFAETFAYDSLNRLQSAQEDSSWGQGYIYDRYGNRRIDPDPAKTFGVGINNKNFTVNTANNRLGVPSGQSGVMDYDLAGNLINDTYTGAGSRSYDAENRMTSAGTAGVSPAAYTYNADGQRVRRKIDGVETWQVYGMDGELLAEYAANASAASPQKEYGYRNGQLLITADAPARTNFALAANGAVATASSTYSPSQGQGYSALPAGAINGDRLGKVGSAITWWNDGTQNSWSDWLQLDFNGSQAIDEVDLFTTQDDYNNPSAPTETMTFSQYGLSSYEVQYWTGAAWVDVPGGNITSNNKVWRKLSFSAITTSKLRVLTNASPDGWSRITELEAWGGGGGQIQWLVTDQLGTPRMIFDKTGDLAATKRHDYLPFGEELFAGTGGRTTAQGYPTGSSAIDGARQKFTEKERDSETGLDYFLARYLSSIQGRFTSPDEFTGGPRELFNFAQAASANPTFYADLTNPQSLNKYQYCLNNPLRFVDPDGHRIRLMDDQTDADRKEIRGRLLFNLNKKERQYFTIAYDKKTKQYTLSLKGNVDKALAQPHTKAFEYLVQTIKHPDTVQVGLAENFATKEGADSTYGTGATVERTRSLSGEVEVYLSRKGMGLQGRGVVVEGLKGEDVAAPKSIIAGHELFGHALQEMLSPTGADPGEQKAIEIENELRRGRGLPPRAH